MRGAVRATGPVVNSVAPSTENGSTADGPSRSDGNRPETMASTDSG